MLPPVNKLSKAIDWKVLAVSVGFALFIFVFEIYFFKTDYIYYNFDYLTYGNWRYMLFCILCELFSLFTFAALCYFSSLSSWRFKPIYLLFFVFTFWHEYGYYNCYHRFSTLTDFYIADGATWSQTLNSINSYSNSLSLVPILVYSLILVKVKSEDFSFGYKTFIGLLSIFLAFYFLVFHLQPKFFTPLEFPTVSTANFSRSIIGYYSSKFLEKGRKRDLIKKPEVVSIPQNNIVLVIDESVKGDHLSLNNYQRSTTPYLEELAKNNLLTNWGIAVSGSTCSISAYNLLITGMSVSQLPDVNKKRWNMPSVFQFAKAMNYKTYYLDGQRSTFWGGTPNDLEYIDISIGVNEFQYDYDTDTRVAKKANEILSTSGGNFILIFKRGLHTPFNTNYPAQAEHWKPAVGDSDFPHSKELQPAFVNAFDNSLAYNLDTFFRTISAGIDYKNNKNIILYTSDHGQTLGENGIRFSHCQDTPNEAKVPLFLLGYTGKPDTKFKPTHANILPTLLDLMSYPESLRNESYDKSLLKAVEQDNTERYYFSPNLERGGKFKFD